MGNKVLEMKLADERQDKSLAMLNEKLTQMSDKANQMVTQTQPQPK